MLFFKVYDGNTSLPVSIQTNVGLGSRSLQHFVLFLGVPLQLVVEESTCCTSKEGPILDLCTNTISLIASPSKPKLLVTKLVQLGLSCQFHNVTWSLALKLIETQFFWHWKYLDHFPRNGAVGSSKRYRVGRSFSQKDQRLTEYEKRNSIWYLYVCVCLALTSYAVKNTALAPESQNHVKNT